MFIELLNLKFKKQRYFAITRIGVQNNETFRLRTILIFVSKDSQNRGKRCYMLIRVLLKKTLLSNMWCDPSHPLYLHSNIDFHFSTLIFMLSDQNQQLSEGSCVE